MRLRITKQVSTSCFYRRIFQTGQKNPASGGISNRKTFIFSGLLLLVQLAV